MILLTELLFLFAVQYVIPGKNDCFFQPKLMAHKLGTSKGANLQEELAGSLTHVDMLCAGGRLSSPSPA